MSAGLYAQQTDVYAPWRESWAEKAEQAKLRREYVDSVKANLRAQLDNTYIKKETGEVVRLSVRSEDDSDTE